MLTIQLPAKQNGVNQKLETDAKTEVNEKNLLA